MSRLQLLALAALLCSFSAAVIIVKSRSSLEHEGRSWIGSYHEVDCGEQVVGAEIEREVVIHNPSNTTLTVKKVSVSCGCIESDLDSPRILPFGNTKLRVAFRIGTEIGPFRHIVNVVFNEASATATNIFYGDILGWYSGTIGSIDFAEVLTNGDSEEKSVRIQLEQPWSFEDIDTIHASDIGCKVRVSNGSRPVLEVSAQYHAKEHEAVGRRSGEIVLRSKTSLEKAIRIPWTAMVVSKYLLSSRSLQLGVVRSGESRTSNVTWTQTGPIFYTSASLSIQKSGDGSDCLSIRLEDGDENDIIIVVEAAPSDACRSGPLRSTVQLMTSSGGVVAQFPVLGVIGPKSLPANSGPLAADGSNTHAIAAPLKDAESNP